VRADVVAAMDDVLDLYEEPYDSKRPQGNCDEASTQWIAEPRTPLPAAPGQAVRDDHDDARHEIRNLFVFTEPQVGWRHIAGTAQRTMHDFAQHMQWLVDVRSPEAEVMRVILDHLNTHKPASLYETFAPAEARRMLKQRAFHSTPTHGSWLHIAEIELSILQRPCLGRRIPDAATLMREIRASEAARNAAQAIIVGRFTTTDARATLHRLYPSHSK
jgi:hypothetical protein